MLGLHITNTAYSNLAKPLESTSAATVTDKHVDLTDNPTGCCLTVDSHKGLRKCEFLAAVTQPWDFGKARQSAACTA